MNTAKPKILAFAGSARRDSFNKKLIRVAAKSAEKAGAEVTLIDLRDFPMPLYDGDLEEAEGVPENALKLRALLKSHPGLLISTPEYNSSIPPLLKNSLDWASRSVGPKNGVDPAEDGMLPYENKIASLVSASPGALGGLRSLTTLRAMLGNMGVLVLPEQYSLGKAHEAFDEEGRLKNARQQGTIDEIGAALARWVLKA